MRYAKQQLKVALELRRNLLRGGFEDMGQKERLIAARPRTFFKTMGEQFGKITDSNVGRYFSILTDPISVTSKDAAVALVSCPGRGAGSLAL
jgi:hypothetical protein